MFFIFIVIKYCRYFIYLQNEHIMSKQKFGINRKVPSLLREKELYVFIKTEKYGNVII